MTQPIPGGPVPQTQTQHLAVLTEDAALRFGNRDVLWFEGRWHRTFELLDRAKRTAGGLLGLGVAPGDRVVVLTSNCPEVGIAYNAVWRAGGVLTPVMFLLSEPELRHILEDSAAVAVVTSPEFLPKVLGAGAGVATLRHIVLVGDLPAGTAIPDGITVVPFAQVEESAPVGIVPRDPEDLGALMYTGGTTGRSKGVMLSHRNLFECGRCAKEAGEGTDDVKMGLVPLPMSHAFGMIVTVGAAFADTPARSVLMRWFEPVRWLELVAEFKVDSAAVVPSMLALLLQQPLEDYDLSSLKYLGCGSAPLSPAVQAEFERRVPGSMVMNGYGCTESGAVISRSTPSHRKPGAVGTPIVDYEVRIVDDAGTVLPTGSDGEIIVRGPGVMKGYWHSPEATATTVRDGWLHTGDIGHLDVDGLLFLVDRKKDLIIRGGFNVFPRDVEDVLLTHPAVAMAGVVGRPDDVRGEEVVAFVSLRPGATATSAELVAYAKERIAATKYPREVRVVDAIPLTSVGKTDRKVLRARARETT